MNIYLDTETDFTHNGLGFLTDILSANVTDNLNGDYSLFFEYKLNGHLSEYIQNENIVKCKVADGTKQLFVIKSIVKTFDSIQVNCKHIFYSLLDNFVENIAPTNLSGQPFLKWILDRTNYSHNFIAYSDITNTNSARYVKRNPVDCILGDTDNSMVNLFGGELKRDNFNIYFNKRVGIDNGVKLIVGKNITGINITIDTNSVHTRIMPQGFDGLMLPEKYIDSPLIDTYVNPKVYKVEFSDIKYDLEDEEAYHDLDEAYNAMRTATNKLFEDGIDKPIINVKIDWIELSKTNEYKNYSNLERVDLGDTLTVDLLGITYKTRVIKTVYNPLNERITSFEVGTPRADIGTSTNKIVKQFEKINVTSILENAKDNATKLLVSALGGNVYKSGNELFIMDTDDPNTATRIWRWNLSGLGYSNNGIDGPYGLAMTMDGQIVADFITTGKLNTSVIEGYDSLTTTVYDTQNVLNNHNIQLSQIVQTMNLIQQQISGEYGMDREVTGTNQVFIEDAMKYYPVQLKISGYSDIKHLLYSGTFYLGMNAVPLAYHEQSLSTITLCIDSQDREHSTENLKEYPIAITNPLRSLGTVKDELLITIEEGELKAQIKRYLSYTGSQIVKLDNPTTETITCPKIELLEHVNYVYIKEQPNYQLYINYLVYSQFNELYATKMLLETTRKQTEDSIIDTVSATYATKSELGTTSNNLSTQIKQKATSVEITASDNQTSAGITVKLKNEDGTELDSQTANVSMSGLVKFTDLSNSGSTVINGSNITTGTISADRVTGGTLKGTVIEGNTIKGGTISGTTINTDKDLTVGDNIYVGQNQDSSIINRKTLKFTENSYIERTRAGASEYMTLHGKEYAGIESNATQILAGMTGINASVPNSSGAKTQSFYVNTYVFGIMNGESDCYVMGGNGGISMSHSPTITSDKRLKKNIKNLDVSWINNLKVKEFEYKNTPNKKQIGLIAQDYVDTDYSKYFLNQNAEGYYEINYGNITNALIQYCQELKQEIVDLKQEIEVLKNER